MTEYVIWPSWWQYWLPMFVLVVSLFVWYFRKDIRARIKNWRRGQKAEAIA